MLIACSLSFNELADLLFKFATMLIALFNVYFVVKIFKMSDRKNDIQKERDRKLQLFQIVILEYNMKNFYVFFESLSTTLQDLKDASLTIHQKRIIEAKVADDFIVFRKNFYDLLLAVNEGLYEKFKTKCDDLQSSLSVTIFDEGINLSHAPKFENQIEDKVSESKTELIKLLFDYENQ